MARRKTIMREDILESAFYVLRTKGAQGLTARNVANNLNCSTQPIYLTFTSMEHLVEELYPLICQRIERLIEQNQKNVGEDPLIDFCNLFIQLSVKETHIFHAMFVQKHFGTRPYYELFLNKLQKAYSESEYCIYNKPQVPYQIATHLIGEALLTINAKMEMNEHERKERMLRVIQEALAA